MAVLWERVKAAFLSDAPSDQSLQKLQSNFSFLEGIRRLRRHQWRKRDLQYCLMVPILIYAFIICKKPTLLPRTAMAAILLYLCTAPAFSQFFLNFMPTGTWLILFYVCRYIDPAYRPPIFVRVLPGLETIFYGGDLSETLAASPNTACDVLAWIPYGLVHFGAPFVVSFLIYIFAPPTTLPVFHFAFGYMNLIGVLTQLCFPNAPPWYRKLHGLEKADYTMPGSAGGLERIDKLLHVDLYSTPFKASPLVFGAFPSLHSGSAVMEALFMSYLFPICAPIVAVYVLWIWWATMYLTHHYFVDLIGGGVLSLVVFNMCRITILPQKEKGKFGRWSYSQLKFGLPLSSRTGRNEDYRRVYDEETALEPYAEDFEMETLRT